MHIDLGTIDEFIDALFKSEVIYPRLKERMKMRLTSPNRYMVESIEALEDGEINSLLRTIQQQDEDIAFLSHQLRGYDSLISKYDKLAIKCANLKRQNKRLLERNKDLVSRVY